LNCYTHPHLNNKRSPPPQNQNSAKNRKEYIQILGGKEQLSIILDLIKLRCFDFFQIEFPSVRF